MVVATTGGTEDAVVVAGPVVAGLRDTRGVFTAVETCVTGRKEVDLTRGFPSGLMMDGASDLRICRNKKK